MTSPSALRQAELGASSAGVWRRAAGVAAAGRSGVLHHLRRGTWQRPFAGVYADGGYALSPEQWGWAAVLASTRPDETGVACLRTAARIWDLPLIDDQDSATGSHEALEHDVSVPRTLASTAGRPGEARLVRRHLLLKEQDLQTLPSGLVVTTPLVTAVQCAMYLPTDAAVCLLDAALHRELVSTEHLAAEVASRAGQPRSRSLARCLALADGRAESPAESLARLLLLPVIPGLVPQVELRNDWDEVVARFDLADKKARFAFEADGKRGHAGEQMVAKDRARDRRTEARGWCTERGTWFDLRRRPQQLLARVLGRYRSHLAKAAA